MPRDTRSAEKPAGVIAPPGDGVARARDGVAAPTRHQIWRNKNFLLLWLAQAVSQTAQNAIWYGIVVQVERLSHSSTQLSLAILTLIIPSVIFGVLAGVYVDRWDKRTVLIATNLIRGGIAFLYAGFSVFTSWPLTLLFVINFVFSTVGQFFAPAETATIPTVL